MATPDILLFHAVPTRSCRVAWLLEELGLPYNTRPVDFPAELSDPEFLKINPLGSVPYMEDGDIKLTESVAMMEYILERYGEGKLAPSMDQDPKARATYLYAQHFFESQLALNLAVYAMHGFIWPEEKRISQVAENAKKNGTKALAVTEGLFADGRKFAAGNEFTAADITAGQALTVGEVVGMLDAEKYPKTVAYFKMLKERPAYGKIFNPPKTE